MTNCIVCNRESCPMDHGKWLEITFKDEKPFNINEDVEGLYLDSIDKIEPSGKTDTLQIDGIDGEIFQRATFGKFSIVTNFIYYGQNSKDLNLFINRLNGMLNKRTPYYIRSFQLPFVMYQVEPTPKISYEYITLNVHRIKVEFECIKGYGESYKQSIDMKKARGDFTFVEGLDYEDDPKYTNKGGLFYIYNGSQDTINPLLHHNLTIKMNLDAPKGFEVKNRTTGDHFKYYEPVVKEDTIEIRDIYPMLNGDEHVGKNTNWEWITLAPGWNKIEFLGNGISNISSSFIFNFIYV